MLAFPWTKSTRTVTHPLGMIAGLRQVVTGLTELRRRDKKLLCTSMCVGSGTGAAGIFVNEVQSLLGAKL
ncbi:uncharacterized protein F5147DRAFT_663785 [Suillus discolor]|uniref:Thiolase C-terminal domain-containing protein n=1 Tax=Suillus discolor TaxID=1912936 RepID=A0A9P7FL44_9AGAM|nr:uncharacterized protein F5147DRAFT_663785 [Suillus discolor]KAG2120926.1 hypothetical protein F5147DRAFT_663785 [Suillus discolor]